MEISITNLHYVEPTNTLIDMDVTFENPMSPDEVGVMPFTYHPDDQEPVSLAIRILLKSNAYLIAPYVAPIDMAKEAAGSTGVNVIA